MSRFLLIDMKNEAAGIQKCVQFEHTGGRRWHLNCSSAAKSWPISVLSYPEYQWWWRLTHAPNLPSEKSHTRCAGLGLSPFFALKSRQNVAKVGNVHFYYVYYHFSVTWPNALEQTTAWKLPLHPRVNFQKKSRKSREKWEIFHCRICTKSITTHKIFGKKGSAERQREFFFFVNLHRKVRLLPS